MAFSRQIIVKSGAEELEGHAFCVGLDALESPTLDQIPQVLHFMRGAIFRPKVTPGVNNCHSPLSDLYPLSELLNLYRMHKSTKLHDKIYALLGMAADDWEAVGLAPAYDTTWKEVVGRLIRHLLGTEVLVRCSLNETVTSVHGRGNVVGKVTHVKTEMRRQVLTFEHSDGEPWCFYGSLNWYTKQWSVPLSSTPVQKDDIVCVLKGSVKPTIIRLHGRSFVIIMIAVEPPNSMYEDPVRPPPRWGQCQCHSEDVPPKCQPVSWLDFMAVMNFRRKFHLVWDWEAHEAREFPLGRQETSIDADQPDHLCYQAQLWDTKLVLADVGAMERAKDIENEASAIYAKEFDVDVQQLPRSQFEQTSLTRLGWTALNGNETMAKWLLSSSQVDGDFEIASSKAAPLSIAAGAGNDSMVDMLIATGKFQLDRRDSHGETALMHAAFYGRTTTLQQLLDKGADPCMISCRGNTALYLAAEHRHHGVVEILCKNAMIIADSNLSDRYRSLETAISRDHMLVARLLLSIGNVDINARDSLGRTMFARSSMEGKDDIIRRLLVLREDPHDCNGKRCEKSSSSSTGSSQTDVNQASCSQKPDIDSKDNGGDTPLLLAAGNGHESAVRLLLATGDVDVNQPDTKSRTPLIRAVWGFHQATVEILLKDTRVNVNAQDEDGWTPLWLAANAGHVGIVNLLLDSRDVDVELSSHSSRTPLYAAVERFCGLAEEQAANTKESYESIITMLVKKGNAKVNVSTYEKRGPIWHAARSGKRDLLKILVQAGDADVNQVDLWGKSAISVTTDPRTLMILVIYGGADINVRDQYGRSSIWHAENASTAELFLATNGVDVNMKDHDGLSPLSAHARAGQSEIVELLFTDPGLDINSVDNEGRNALWHSFDLKTTQLILAKTGIDVNATDRFGISPLCKHAWCNTDIVELLLGHPDIDVNLVDNEGRNALWHAADARTAKLLVASNSIDIDRKDVHGQSPLAIAAERNSYDIVDLLLSTGRVDVDSTDNELRTPLWHGVSRTDRGPDFIAERLLQEEDINVNLKDKKGRAPLSIAAEYHRERTLRVLLESSQTDVNTADEHNRTPLWYAMAPLWSAMKTLGFMGTQYYDPRPVPKMLIESGKADVNLGDTSGRSPLSIAAGHQNLNAMQLLLDTGRVNVDTYDTSRRTPLSYLLQGKSMLWYDPKQEKFEEYYTAIPEDIPGYSNAHLAYESIVRQLLVSGRATLDLPDESGRAPLSYAAEVGALRIIQMLLDTYGVDVHAADHQNRTPITWAELWGNEEVVEMMKKYARTQRRHSVPFERRCSPVARDGETMALDAKVQHDEEEEVTREVKESTSLQRPASTSL